MTFLTAGNFLGGSIQTIVGRALAEAGGQSVSGELTGIEFGPGCARFSGTGNPAAFQISVNTAACRIIVTRNEITFHDVGIGTTTTITKTAKRPIAIT